MRIFFILLLSLILIHAKQGNNILILHSYGNSYNWTRTINESILNVIGPDSLNNNIDVEYMDCKKYNPELLKPIIITTLQTKFSSVESKPDIIITSDNIAFDFIVNLKGSLFKDIPLVFCGVNNFNTSMLSGYKDITGVTEETDILETIYLIHTLQPTLKHLAIVNDSTVTGIAVRNKIFDEFEHINTSFTSHDFIGLSVEALKDSLSTLDENSAILYGTFFIDKNGQRFSAYEAISHVLNATNLQVYVHADNQLYFGASAGSVVSGYMQGYTAANLAMKILSGESIDNLAIVTKNANEKLINYPSFIKRGGDESRITSDIKVINKKETIWMLYKYYIIAASIWIIVLSVAILFLVIEVKLRKKSQRKEIQIRLLLERVINQIPSMIIWTGKNGEINGHNIELDNFLQTNRNLVGENIINLFESIGIAEKLSVIISQVTKNKESIHHERIETNMLNGQKHYSISVIPLSDNLNIDELLIIVNDITTQIETEQKLRHSSKMEAIGTLAGGIAHDFNNLLVAIIGNADLMNIKKSYEPDRVEKIKYSALRGAQLVKQLLDFSRNTPVLTEVFNCDTAINNAVYILRHSIPPSITISVIYKAKNHTVFGIKPLLESAFINLAINGRDSIKEQGEIVFSTQNVYIGDKELDTRKFELIEGEYLQISISDTGTGIPYEIQDRIFDPFFSTKAEKGNGLGLSNVYSTVTKGNGAIDFETSEAGTTFHIFLPCASKTDNEILLANEENEPLRGLDTINTTTVLVVDDEEIIRDTVNLMLEEIGFTNIIKHDGIETIDRINRGLEPDIIILDLMMPKVNGIDILKMIRQKKLTSKVILSSGFYQEEFQKDIDFLKPDAFLMKPYSYEDMKKILLTLVK